MHLGTDDIYLDSGYISIKALIEQALKNISPGTGTEESLSKQFLYENKGNVSSSKEEKGDEHGRSTKAKEAEASAPGGGGRAE